MPNETAVCSWFATARPLKEILYSLSSKPFLYCENDEQLMVNSCHVDSANRGAAFCDLAAGTDV